MAAPLVSVVLPVFNGAAFVAEAVASIVAQSLREWELLVVDDGSTDDTPRIVQAIGDARVRYIASPVRQGAGAARNIGLRLARGTFVALQDHDDLSHPDRLARQVEHFARHPACVVCGSDVAVTGAAIAPSNVPAQDAAIKALFLAAGGNILNPTAMFRREFTFRHGICYRPDLVVGEDLDLWMQFLRAGAEFANLKQPLVTYRIHEHNTSLQRRSQQSRLLRLRADIVGTFFPDLSHREAGDLAAFLECDTLSLDQICRGVAASHRALADGTSRFGEDRALQQRLLQQRLQLVLAHVAVRPASSAKSDGNAT